MILANCAHYLCRVQIEPWQASSTTAAEARRSQLTQIWIIEARRRSSWWSQAQLVTQTHGHGVVTGHCWSHSNNVCNIVVHPSSHLWPDDSMPGWLDNCRHLWQPLWSGWRRFSFQRERDTEGYWRLPDGFIRVVSFWNIMKKVSLERAQRQIASEKPDKAD